jgi:microcystin-dependent protein
MSFRINNINSLVPVGCIISTLSTNEPDGWILADGVTRPLISGSKYDSLINLQIGTAVYGGGQNTYAPPNLKAAFLRGTGTNGSYTGASGFTNCKTQVHKHTAIDTAHTHANDATGGTSKGLAIMNGLSAYPGAVDGNGTTEINVIRMQGIDMANATIGISVTATQISNRGQAAGQTVETSPYCVGVNWLIKY